MSLWMSQRVVLGHTKKGVHQGRGFARSKHKADEGHTLPDGTADARGVTRTPVVACLC